MMNSDSGAEQPQELTAQDLKYATDLLSSVSAALIENGAETRLAEQMPARLAKAFGLSDIEISVEPSYAVVRSGSAVSFAKINGFGTNFRYVTNIGRLCIHAETGKIKDFRALSHRISAIHRSKYSLWLLIPFTGFACGTFALLSGAHYLPALTAAVAASFGSAIKFLMIKGRFNVLPIFATSAFCSVSAAEIMELVLSMSPVGDPSIVAAVLYLIPGVPLMNSVLDGIKGFYLMAVVRLTEALMLIFSAVLGIFVASFLFGGIL